MMQFLAVLITFFYTMAIDIALEVKEVSCYLIILFHIFIITIFCSLAFLPNPKMCFLWIFCTEIFLQQSIKVIEKFSFADDTLWVVYGLTFYKKKL